MAYMRRTCEAVMALRDMRVTLWWQTEAGCLPESCPWLRDSTRASRHGSVSGFDSDPWEGAQDEAQRSDHTRVLSRSDRHPGGCTACCIPDLRLRSGSNSSFVGCSRFRLPHPRVV